MIKNKFVVEIKNSDVKAKKGYIRFKRPLVITDNTRQRNGTKYDIKSMDISEYKGSVTADHGFSISSVIGTVEGLVKLEDRVEVNGINFAVKESPLAKFAYNMLKAGFLTDFSIETYGDSPDENGVYKNAKLVGLSLVTIGNNKSAYVKDKIYEMAMNSMENADESTKEILSSYIINFQNKMETDKKTSTSKEDVVKNDASTTVEKTIADAFNKMEDRLTNMEANFAKKVAEISAKEPEFQKTENPSKKDTVVNKFKDLDWKDVYSSQVTNAWDYLKGGSIQAGEKLRDLNEYNLEKLKEKGIVANSVTIADFGNFVISPELLSKIEGHRSDFSQLINALDFQETRSLQMAWLSRNGDIDMQEVEMCDDDADGNLKPISEYTATINQANLHELAAVTPVCNATTRFLAVDLIEDVAKGYRTDYERKLAQLFVARMQQASNVNGNVATYNRTSATTGLTSWIDVFTELSDEVSNGIYIFNNATYGQLMVDIAQAGVSGPLSHVIEDGTMGRIMGHRYIVVPNELLPTLNTPQTKSFTVESSAVTINRAVFFINPDNFKGRTSGGLQYDMSTHAAYEDGGTVKSAFQRNELVLRGSFFRNGQVLDTDKVSALGAIGVS